MKPVLAFALVCTVSAQIRFRIEEPAGIERVNEPVLVKAAGREQVMYVNLKPRERRIVAWMAPKTGPALTETSRAGARIDTGIFLADLTARTVSGKQEDSGVLRALTFKQAGVTLLRSENRMHWAPSFQRAGARGYTSWAMWDPVQTVERAAMPGWVRYAKSGYHALYPEIHLDTEYRFFSHVPYFLFRSRVTIERAMEMFWLRNQEMTMDSFFTHCAWPEADGTPRIATFEERKPLLEESPIPADTPWIAFLHPAKGYGFGAVILGYEAAKTANAMTSINDGANDGKYWDRRIINQINVPMNGGEVFTEETAYVLFRANAQEPLAEFLAWEKKLRNPVRASPVR